jgi:hypothetical protein
MGHHCRRLAAIAESHLEMSKKRNDKALAKFEAKRDVWQEVLDGVREIKAGGGKRAKVKTHRTDSRAGEESGEYLLKETKKPRNKGLVKLLLSCPVKNWFQPLDRTETTDEIKPPRPR